MNITPNNTQWASTFFPSEEQLKKTAAALEKVSVSNVKGSIPRSEKTNEPGLREPEVKTNGARLTELLLTLGQLLTQSSLDQLINRLQLREEMQANAYASLGESSSKYQDAMGKAEQAQEVATTALTEAKKATKQAQEAALEMKKAQQHFDAAEAALAKLSDKKSPEYAAACKTRDQAQLQLTTATHSAQKAKTAEGKAIDNAGEHVKDAELALQTCDKLDAELNQICASIPRVREPNERDLANQARMTELFAEFLQLLGKNSETKLANEHETFVATQKARETMLGQKLEDYQAEIKKSETIGFWASLVAKVLGWALTIVGVAAALFTGGASLVIAGIGLTIALGDEIYNAVTGKSLISTYVMEPVMEHVIQPIIEALTKEFAKALVALGVDPNTAEEVARIAATVYVFLVIAVLAIVAGAAAGKLMGQVTVDASKQLMINALKTACAVGSVALLATQLTGTIWQGVVKKGANDEVAALTMGQNDLKQSGKTEQQSVSALAALMRQLDDLLKSLLECTSGKTQASKGILDQVRMI